MARNFNTSSISQSSSGPKNEVLAQAAIGIFSTQKNPSNEVKSVKFNVDGKEQSVAVQPSADGFKIQVNDGEWKNVQVTTSGENGKINMKMNFDGSVQESTLSISSEGVTIFNDSGKTELKFDQKNFNSSSFNGPIIPMLSASTGGASHTLYYLAAFTVGIQWVVFLHAGGFFGNERTEKYYDLTGSLTYLSSIALSLFLTNNIGMRQVILSSFVAIWAARLGWFLYTRIHNNNGIDSRFENLKKDNFKFWTAWTMQGLWVFTCLFPVLKLSQLQVLTPLTTLDYAGFGLWASGFIFEIIADHQKRKFRENPENKGKFIDSGLWSISRHPNYFGEILLWTGISLAAYSGTKSPLVFISPVFVSLLLVYISGIPLLEKSADEKFGGDKKYQDYKKNTPVLIPFIGRKGDATF